MQIGYNSQASIVHKLHSMSLIWEVNINFKTILNTTLIKKSKIIHILRNLTAKFIGTIS